MKKKLNTKAMVLMGMLTAILILFSFTPIGSIPVGPLVITLNVIPVAIAAIALGPIGGAAMGAVFGTLSFLQCIGIHVPLTVFLWDSSSRECHVQRVTVFSIRSQVL